MNKKSEALLKQMNELLENKNINANERAIVEPARDELAKHNNDLRVEAQLMRDLRPFASKQTMSEPTAKFYNDLATKYGNQRGTFILP